MLSNQEETRLYSSRRVDRISQHVLRKGEGGVVPGGAWSRGVWSQRGGAWSRVGLVWGIPACTEADPPCGQNS